VALGALEGAALIVLIIASLNVANMQLARGASRRKEIAMRLALGAGRGRIVGQLMIEGLLLAAAGGVLGVAVGVWVLDAVAASLAAVLPKAVTVDAWPDWRVALACLACCTLSAIAFGLGPALRLSRLDLLPEMKSQEGRGAGRSLGRFGGRNLLVASQIALSLALLAGAGLFVRGAVAAGSAEPGYSYERQFLVRLDAATAGLGETAGREAYRQLLEKIRSTPGVESASPATFVAFANQSSTRRVSRPGAAQEPGAASTTAGTSALCFEVGARYFETLRLPMLRGREFTQAEEVDPGATGVAVIDEPLAAALFPGEDPLGQFIEFGPGAAEGPMQVVGVAAGVRHRLSDAGPVPHIYLPAGPHYRALLSVHVRGAADGAAGPADTRETLRATIRRADLGLAVLGVQTLAEWRDSMPMNWVVGTAARTFGGFGLVALFVATLGLYGVKAYLVARRTREFGIRLALGASGGGVIRMVLKEGAALLLASIGVGVLLAVGLGQVVGSLLVGVQPFDPLVLGIATLVLGAAVLAACYVPARRATRISPMTALRVE
jgi:predicted permease